jgi:two-component system, NtrC family, sensor kinase
VAVAGEIENTELVLRERIKELRCLYEVLRLGALGYATPLSEILRGVVDLIPPAWHHPERTSARLALDGEEHLSSDFRETEHSLRATISVDGEARGRIEVFCRNDGEEPDAEPFLEEERHLIEAIAREVSGIIERRRQREERKRLEEQLRHADRLATLGQLAAGVAHELNEPLANILGFAQLASKTEGLDQEPARDIERIIGACMHAREIVSKLRLFARQQPGRRVCTDLNEVVREGSLLVASRAEKQGVEIMQDLEQDLPEITADPGQLHQVVVNLAINAVQAMPDGGTLTIRTRGRQAEVALFVIDNGAGMSEEVMKNAFLPFFTTKEVDQGTGLGLSVVQGIVAAHGGDIQLESSPGEGTCFELRLPREGEPCVAEAKR